MLKRINIFNKETDEMVTLSDIILSTDEAHLQKCQSEVARVKKIVSEIPQHMGWTNKDLVNYLSLQGHSSKYVMKADSISASSTYRTDMIMTSDGLKVLEFNIDNTLPQCQVSDNLKKLLGLSSSYTSNFLNLSGLPLTSWLDLASDFVLNRPFNKPLVIWDVDRDSEYWMSQRHQILSCLSKLNKSQTLVTGIEQLVHSYDSKLHTRMFAYIHLLQDSICFPQSKELINEIASSIIFDNKLLLGYLFEEQVQEKLTSYEITLIEKYIPKTILTKSLNLQNKVDLVNTKNQWILKKGNSWQGQNVVFGSLVSEEVFLNILSLNDWIAQEYVKPIHLPVNLINGSDRVASQGTNLLNFFYTNNRFSGSLIRLSKKPTHLIGAIDYKNIIPVPFITHRSAL